MQLREDAQWSLAIATSMGIRITPENHQPVHTSSRYMMHATSAESNVASVISYLGEPTMVLTNFVADSPMSAFIKSDLRSRGMSFRGPDKPQGDAWGYRHLFNIADSGYGARAPRVWNDRAGEVGLDLDAADFDLDRLFVDEGVKIVHLSGLVAALSPKTTKFCLDVAEKAKANGCAVSMDMNYRESFWKNRQKELREAFLAIAEKCDILIGNEEDFQCCLGIEGPEAGGEDLEGKIGNFKDMIGRIRKQYPQAQFIATTLREVISVNRHMWGRSGPSGRATPAFSDNRRKPPAAGCDGRFAPTPERPCGPVGHLVATKTSSAMIPGRTRRAPASSLGICRNTLPVALAPV